MARTFGFIGLGDIGEPMARNLCGDGCEAVVYDLRESAVATLVESGAKAASSCREVAERSEVIGVCVMDDAATRSVVTGDDGVFAGARPDSIVAIHSTVHPDTVRGLAEQGVQRGVHVVDAQMTGGRDRAASGELRFMVGGEPEIVERLRPYLERSASQITHCGALGSGAVAKLCNNFVQFNAWLGFVEAELLASQTGLEREKLHEVLGWIMNDNARAMLGGRAALEANPDNDFLRGRFTDVMHLAEKDLSLALQVARDAEVAMPAAALVSQQLARLFGVPDPKRR
jgi:3-hydroxyisobutyrate dehydrogenase